MQYENWLILLRNMTKNVHAGRIWKMLVFIGKECYDRKHETMGGSHEENHKIYWKQRLL